MDVSKIREYIKGYNVRFDGPEEYYYFDENNAKDFYIDVIVNLNQGEVVELMKNVYKISNYIFAKFIVAVIDEFKPSLLNDCLSDRRLGKKASQWYFEIGRALIIPGVL